MTQVTMSVGFTEQELWETVFGSDPETFGRDWWVSWEYLDGADWDKAGKVSITLTHPDNDEGSKFDHTITKVLDAGDLVRALEKVVATGNRYTQWLDLDSYDSVAADVIIQTAIYGEIIFG